MVANRSSGFVVSCLLLGLLAVFSLPSLLAGGPPAMGAHVQRSSQATLEPGPGTVEPSETAVSDTRGTCRLLSSPWTPLGDDGLRVTLHNAGSRPVVLYAVELGWRGDSILREIALQHPSAAGIEIYGEPAASPALLTLNAPDSDPEALVIEAGASLDLMLGFDVAEDRTLANDLISALVYLEEGCVAPLGAAREPRERCPIVLGAPTIAPQEPKLLRFDVENEGEKPVELAALEISWPRSANGRLLALHVDGKQRHEFRRAYGTSPIFLDLRRAGLSSVLVEPGAALTLALEFQNEAAPEPYLIAMVTRDGCQASTSTYPFGATPDCGVQVVGFDSASESVRLRLANGRPVPRMLSDLEVFWPARAAGPLVQVRMNGVQAWHGSAGESPALVRFERDPTIGAHSTADLQLVFSPTVESGSFVNGNVGGDYAVAVTFQGGCRLAYSTLAGRALGCSLSAGEMIIDQAAREVSVDLTNAAADAILRQLAVSWPARNGALTGLWLDDDRLIDRDVEVPPSRAPFQLQLGGKAIQIPRNDSQPLRMQFEDRASRNGYTLSLAFEDPRGEACQLLITSREIRPDCRLELGEPRIVDLRFVEFDLHNAGQDEVEIRFIHADWPNPDRTNVLNQIVLVDPSRPEPLLVWQPQGDETARPPPAQVVPNGEEAPILDAKTVVTLRMRFKEMLESIIVDPARSFNVTVGTVEGCQGVYSKGGAQAAPERTILTGVIRKLPEAAGGTGVLGTWIVEARGIEHRVEVDRATHIVPSTVTPRVGSQVQVEAISLEDDRLRALEITFQMGVPGATIHGTITDLDAEHEKPQWIRIGKLHVHLLENTMVIGELELGAEVSVDGKENPDGTFAAVAVTVTEPAQGEQVAISGVIQNRTTSTEVRGEDWTVDKYRVIIEEQFLPAEASPDPQLRAAVGKRVQVVGRLTGRVIRATQVVVVRPDPTTRRLAGIVTDMPATGHLGEWTIRTPAGTDETFMVESLAIVDTRSAPAEEGMAVDAIVEIAGDSAVALRVRMEWP